MKHAKTTRQPAGVESTPAARDTVMRSGPADVCGDAAPTLRPELPVVGVPAGASGSVGLLVGCAGFDDGEVAEQQDLHIVLADVLDGRAAADLRQESVAVQERAVWIGVVEAGRNML